MTLTHRWNPKPYALRARTLLAITLLMTPTAASQAGDDAQSTDEVRVRSSEIFTVTPPSRSPFGVGRIELEISPESNLRWWPDEPIRITSSKHGVWYPAFEWQDGKAENEPARLTAWFLTIGHAPHALSIEAPSIQASTDQPVRVTPNSEACDAMLREWFSHFRKQGMPEDPPEIRRVRKYYQSMLARRLNLPESSQGQRAAETMSLEVQFERAVSMLFGFESARLAMMTDIENPLTPMGAEVANQRLPSPIGIPAVRIPSKFTVPHIEPLARQVPADCFYLRCGRVANYLWVRHIVTSWGGSLGDIVSTSGLDHDIRARLEQQLGLNAEFLMNVDVDKEINDFALIGGDVFFQEGAAVGAVFERSENSSLQLILDEIRSDIAKGIGVPERTVQIAGHKVSLYETDDHAMRSFHVNVGDYDLVTNSEYLIRKFIEVSRNGNSLGDLKEYQYAISQQKPSSHLHAYLYLPDAFFRHITSPAVRAEVGRRRQSLQDLSDVVLAQNAARAEGFSSDSISDLVKYGFLRRSFNQRADESEVILDADRVYDSLRGYPGFFVPVSDIEVTKVTRGEAQAYSSFSNRYRQEWRAMDPVILSFSRMPGSTLDVQKVDLEILITPYAQQEYRFLTEHLAPAGRERVPALVGSDIMGISARLKDKNGKHYQVHAGLHEDEVSFTMSDGEVHRKGPLNRLQYGQSHAYGAVSPRGSAGLNLLSQFVKSVQNRRINTRNELTQSARSSTSSMFFRFLLSALIPSPVTASKDGEWSLVTASSRTTRDSADMLDVSEDDEAAQIHFQMRDVNQTKIAEYLRAHTFLRSRRAAATNMVLVNEIAFATHTPVGDVQRMIETCTGAELVNPMGGEFGVFPLSTGSQLSPPTLTVSDSLGVSLYKATEIPQDYRFPFLDWMRNLDVRFALENRTRTLRSAVSMTLKTPVQISFTELHAFNRTNRQSTGHLAGQIQQLPPHRSPFRVADGPQDRQRREPTPVRPQPTETVGRSNGETIQPGVLGIYVRENTLVVTAVDKNSPAERCGIQIGDRIMKIGKIPVTNHPQLVRKLQTAVKPGTRITVTVKRGERFLILSADINGGRRA